MIRSRGLGVMGELPFVGVERAELVARLLDSIDDTIATGSPRLVTLEASSGWGKTRVVQEFYARLAAERQESAFWPPSILGAVPASDRATLDSPGGRRKRIYPASFTSPKGSLPEWLWWGVSATARKGGSPVHALAADLEQIERLRAALLARLAELNPESPWAKVFRGLRSEDSREIAWEAAENAVAQALTAAAITTTPLGFLVLAGRMGWKNRERLRRLAGSSKPEELGQADVRGAQVRETAEALGRFAAGGIPTILVVEDAHQADETLIDLLVTVLNNGRGPILVIATAWPGVLEQEGRQAQRLLTEVEGPVVERITPEELSDIERGDRVNLVGLLLPSADSSQRAMLADKWSNPLALEVGCRLPAVGQMLLDGELTQAAVDALPLDVEGLYREMWEDLPFDVRQAMMLAVLATPATVSGRLFDDRTWDVDLPAVAAAGLEWLQGEARELRSRLMEDATAYDWVRRVDEWLQAFHDPAHHVVAADAALDPSAYSPGRRRAYYQALADAISLDDEDDADPAAMDRRRAQARLLVSLAFEGFVDWGAKSVAAADLLIEQLAEAPDTQSLRTLVALADAVPVTSSDPGFDRRRSAALALGRLGHHDAAVTRLTALLDEQSRTVGEDDPAVFLTRKHLATSLGRSGQVEAAVDRLSGLLADQRRVLGEDHPDTLRTHINLAGFVLESGRADDAVEEFSVMTTRRAQALGEEHPETLWARYGLAMSLADSGQVAEAVEQMTSLVADRTRASGEGDTATLWARYSLATLLGRSGRVEDAIEEFAALVADRVRLTGADDPGTLAARHGLAVSLGKAGRSEVAVDQSFVLLEDAVRVFGADHPETLRAQANLVLMLRLADRAEDAVEQMDGIVAQRVRAFGAGHPEALRARESLVLMLHGIGRQGEAIERLAGIIADRVRASAVDDPRTLVLRHSLAVWLGESGRVEEAIEQLADLSLDRARVSGEDDPRTLQARQSLALMLEIADRIEEAAQQLVGLIDDQVRVLGEEHPDTLESRGILASCLARLGRVEEAAERFTRLVADYARFRGATHSDTLAARIQLALSIASAGDLEEGVSAMSQVAEDCRRLLGEEDPLTRLAEDYLERLSTLLD